MLTVEQVIDDMREYYLNAYWIDESLELIRAIQDVEIAQEKLRYLKYEYGTKLAKYQIMKDKLAFPE